MIRAKGWKVTQGQIHISNIAEFVITSGGAKNTSARTSAWNDPISHIFTTTFASVPAATLFFSSGGQIRLSGDRVGGSATAQNTSYAGLLSSIGSISFADAGTTRTGIAGSDTVVGYTSLTGSYQTIFFATSTTAQYTTDQYLVEALITGAVITFKVTMIDALDNLIDEAADGTLTSYIDERRYYTTPSPTYATIGELELPPATATPLEDVIVATGPINYWRLDETTGTVLVDTMQNEDHTSSTDFSTAGISVASTRNDGVGSAYRGASVFNIDTVRCSARPWGGANPFQDGTLTFALGSTLEDAGTAKQFMFGVGSEGWYFGLYHDGATGDLVFENRSEGTWDPVVIATAAQLTTAGFTVGGPAVWFQWEVDTNTDLSKVFINNAEISSIDSSVWLGGYGWMWGNAIRNTYPSNFSLNFWGDRPWFGIRDEVTYWDRILSPLDRSNIYNVWADEFYVPLLPPPLLKGVPMTALSGGDLTFNIDVPAGATNLTISTSGGTGDVELIAKTGSFTGLEVGYSDQDLIGNTDEQIVIANPTAETHYIIIGELDPWSGVTLLVDWTI